MHGASGHCPQSQALSAHFSYVGAVAPRKPEKSLHQTYRHTAAQNYRPAGESHRTARCSYGLARATAPGRYLQGVPTSCTVNHAVGNGIRLRTTGPGYPREWGDGVFLYVRCASGSAWAITGRGLRRRNPSRVKSLWHCRTPNAIAYFSAR